MRSRVGTWWASRTLRWQLIAGLLTLLVLTCVAIGVATTYALHGFLVDRLDQQLSETQPRVAFSLQRGGPGGPGALGPQVGTFGARLVAGHVADAFVVTSGAEQASLRHDVLSATDLAKLDKLAPNDQPHTVSFSHLGRYRVLAFTEPDGDKFVSGLPLSDVRATLHRLELIELVVFGAVLILAGLAGTGLVRVSLRPLRRVAATAHAVAETPLGTGEVTLPPPVPESNPWSEVGQVGSAFNQMLEHVQAAFAQRQATEARLRQFIADASHELRTPLAGIRSHAELATRRHELPPEVAHSLHRVEAEASRMGVLVDDLLLLARLDAGRPLAREEVDLTRLVLDAVSDARVASADHRWVLELPDDPVLTVGDPHRLHQVLANLLTNARVHTPAGTTVSVRLGRVASGVQVSVADDGPGIPPDLQDKVFERFVRADTSRARTTGSSGLGLAIVHAVVQAHGGRVTLASDPGHTEFRVVLPAVQQSEQTQKPVAATS